MKNARLKYSWALGRPAISGNTARMIGTAPRSPTQEMKAFSRPWKARNGSSPTSTDNGRANRIIHNARPRAGRAMGSRSWGVTSSPSTRNMPICASQAMPSSMCRMPWRLRTGRLPITRPHRYTARKPLPCRALVRANTTSPPAITRIGYRPLARWIRLTSCSISQPPPRPITAPMPNSRTRSTSRLKCKPVWPLASMSIRVTVRNTAIGSLLPDSISRLAVTRSLRPLPPNSENTAAASVEPTMAPISRPWIRLRSNSQAAAMPVSPVVISTPTVASESAGHRATRKLATRVRRPPSRRITARARLPTR